MIELTLIQLQVITGCLPDAIQWAKAFKNQSYYVVLIDNMPLLKRIEFVVNDQIEWEPVQEIRIERRIEVVWDDSVKGIRKLNLSPE